MKLLISVVIFLFICNALFAQNDVQSEISQAIDSVKSERYGSAIRLMESITKEEGLTQKQANKSQMLLEIAYFKNRNLNFDLLKLENSVNNIETNDPFNIKGFLVLMEVNNNLKLYDKSLLWGRMGLSLFNNQRINVYYAELLGEVAECYFKLEKFQKSVDYYLQAIQIVKQNYENNHKLYSFWLMGLASCYAKLGDYEKAIEFELQSINRTENFTKVLQYSKLAGYYLKLGDTLENKEYLAKFKNGMLTPEFKKFVALDYIKNNSDAIATDYLKSIENQKNKIEQQKRKFGENSNSYATSLEKLATFHFKLNSYDEAIDILLKAISIYKNLYGENDSRYIDAMSDLALYYGKSQNYSKALEIGYKVLQAQQKAIGISDSDRITSLSKLNFFTSLFISLEPAYKNISTSLHNLAFYHSGLGEYDDAIRQDNDALLILKKVGNKRDFNETKPLEALAFNYLSLNNFDESARIMNQLFSIRKEIISDKFSFYTEKEKTTYWNNLKGSFETVNPSYSYQVCRRNPSISKFAYDNELFKKGLLLNTLVQLKRAILESKDSIQINNWVQYQKFKREIIRLLESTNNQQFKIDSLQLQADKLDKELTQKSQVYRQAQSEQQIKWQDVQSKLKDGEVAVEFSSFRYFHKEWTDSTLYCALVLKKGMEYPAMVPLCEQKQLDSLFVGGNATPNNLYASRGVTAEYKNQLPNGQKLYRLIWQPLEKELQNVKTVYYSPSGSLHQISFAALPTDTIHYLCDKYNLVQLSSTRQLATAAWQTKSNQISSTALFGGIKYDIDNQEIAELQRSLPPKEINNSRGFIPDSTRSSTSFGFLQGTKDEVETISAMLQSNRLKTTLYTGLHGNEEAFKALSNQNTSVLHIATHGFFYPDLQQKPERLDGLMSLGEQRFRYVPNPLLRSGLILSGGNRAWTGEEPIAGMEDGILTAQEISEMNLQNTELVVLSACETGLGDIKGGEGVFGLQRAFKLAGVKTIIMSLWKVDDKATSEMMQLFYSKWLDGMDKRESFRLAQQELKKKYKEPYYWAGFVMLD